MSGASQRDGHDMARAVPAAWRRFMRAGESVGASASVRAGGTELAVDVIAQVEFLDDRRLDVHLVLADQEPTDAQAPGHLLTRRERAVVALIAQGLETQEIADTLYISAATVKTHVRNAMEKVGAHTRAQLVAVALAGPSTDALLRSGDPSEQKSSERVIDLSPARDDQ
jgi:DNA-binding NarL/FixJ family response regulator